ncbi:MAG: aminotransferase class III-fold pyridoxal phosphate-dependent enzyme [Alphaproteobacteria bacterium]|nr:aminotransferase class III-fold pyridoxal phosphate-dependent enzyme [Alphaproteobacteria bacterium]
MPRAKKPVAKPLLRSGRQTKRWQALDAAHHIHPFTQSNLLAAEGARVITRAKGIYLWDSNGVRIVDGMSGLWCVQIGYGNRELAQAGYDALKQLPYYNHFFKTTNPWTIELAARLTALLPDGHTRLLFADSGSEANDTALKLIRYYWNLKGRPEKKIHLSRALSYHGVTMATASLSGLTPMHPQWDLPFPGFEKVPAPYWYGAKGAGYGDIDPEEFGALVTREMEKKIVDIGPDRIASFSAEPVQGAGGLIVPPANYWPEVMRICRRYDILFHADEVITGFGRTGEWFGSFTYNLQPDIITMAKGLSSGYQPISAISLGSRMGDAIAAAGEELVHGYTYSGHPVACAVALKNVEILKRDGIVTRVKRKIGPYFQRRVREVFADHPLVGEVRGAGMLAAMELVENKAERQSFPKNRNAGTICRDHCFENGLVMRAIRDTMVLAPALIITEVEIEHMLRKAKLCIDLTAKDLGVL